jgi:hypothetical protein
MVLAALPPAHRPEFFLGQDREHEQWNRGPGRDFFRLAEGEFPQFPGQRSRGDALFQERGSEAFQPAVIGRWRGLGPNRQWQGKSASLHTRFCLVVVCLVN